VAKDAGIDVTAEELRQVVKSWAEELDESQLSAVAGGCYWEDTIILWDEWW